MAVNPVDSPRTAINLTYDNVLMQLNKTGESDINQQPRRKGLGAFVIDDLLQRTCTLLQICAFALDACAEIGDIVDSELR